MSKAELSLLILAAVVGYQATLATLIWLVGKFVGWLPSWWQRWRRRCRQRPLHPSPTYVEGSSHVHDTRISRGS